MKKIDENNFSRIELAIIEKFNCTHNKAKEILSSLKLYINCGQDIYKSKILQAALLTAVNTGSRAFLGGVYVYIPANVECLIDWPRAKALDKIVKSLGGNIVDKNIDIEEAIYIGQEKGKTDCYRVIANEWQGGLLVPGDKIELPLNCFDAKLCCGGIAAAAITVGLMFLKKTTIDSLALLESRGISLWKPDLNWYDNESGGPKLKYLPKKYWALGLGHLGQAYLWNINFLPYKNTSEIIIYLQDADKIIKANIDSGLLTNKGSVDKLKTRICQKFLEQRGFQTRVIERKFDKYFKVNKIENEPLVALCGFDNPESRMALENSGFDYIVNCGLGATLDSFYDIIVDSLPNPEFYKLLTTQANIKTDIKHKTVNKILNEESKDICGILNIANKAISTSFVGALASSFVLGDILRGLNGGNRYIKTNCNLRDISRIKVTNQIPYKNELATNGYLNVS